MLRWYYSVDATTVLEITDRVRWPTIEVGAHADSGSGWEGDLFVDDPDGDFIPLMFRRIYAIQDAAPAGSQTVGNWFISNIKVKRTLAPVLVQRTYVITMADENSLLNRRKFVGSDANRAWPVGGAIVSASVANPTVITTTTAHGLTTGDYVVISGLSGSTPAVDGLYQVTVTGANTYTVPVHVTVAGSGGTTTKTETDIQRLRWALTTTEFNVFSPDETYIDTSNPIPLDPYDFRTLGGDDLMNSLMQASGKHYWIKFEEAAAVGGAIVSSSVAGFSLITTTTAHGLFPGMTVVIAGHSGSTPSINGTHTVLTTPSPTTYTIDFSVTVGGTGGTTTTTSRYVIWYANMNTSTLYSSTAKLSNLLSEVGVPTSTLVWPLSGDAELDRAGGRMASGMVAPYRAGWVYVQDTTVGDTYAYVDRVAPAPTVTTRSRAIAQVTRQLGELDIPDDELTTVWTVDEANLNLIMHGMRVQVHGTHFPDWVTQGSGPGYADGYVWFRVMERTVRQVGAETFAVSLRLSPQTVEITITMGVFFGNSGYTLWPTGWNVLYSLGVPAAGGGHPLYIQVARGPAGANSVKVCATAPCGGGSLGNSVCLMMFEVTGTIGLLTPITSGQNTAGGDFIWPDVTMPGPGLLLAPMMRWASAVPRNDPDSADGWQNTKIFRGTSTTSFTIGSGLPGTIFATQPGLSPYLQFGGDHSTIYFVSRANPANWMIAFIDTYNNTTGDLTVEPNYRFGGSGTHSDWDIYMGFNSFNDLGDRDYVNCEDQTVASGGTYGGSEAASGSNSGVVVIPFEGVNAAIARAGTSGLIQGGASSIEIFIQ